MARFLVLAVIVLALLGAALHPLLFVLNLLPFDSRGLTSVLDIAKSFIADLLAWGLIGLIAAMGTLVAFGRWSRRRSGIAKSSRSPGAGSASEPAQGRMVVAITAYNEADAITGVVKDFSTQEGVVKTIVIDNNSEDATAALARRAGATVIQETRQGYGYACLRGLEEALKVHAADVVSSRLTTRSLVELNRRIEAGASPSSVASAWLAAEEADIVVGTRVVPGLVEPGSQMDYFFTWGNIAVSALLRLRFWDSQFLGAARLSDVGCTYRAIRRDAVLRILPALEVGQDHFSPHMMLVALDYGLSLIEIPITFRRRIGTSKGASRSMWKGLRVGLAMMWHIMTYQPRRPVLDRGPRSLAPPVPEDVAAGIASGRS